MLEQFRKFARYCLVPGSILLNIQVADVEKMPDLDDVAENDEEGAFFGDSEEHTRRFNKKALDLVGDLARMGYI